MKIIINESQYKLIVENEDENLFDITQSPLNFYKWDDVFEHINKKKGYIYKGYYINLDLDLSGSDITELKYLVKVGGNLNISKTPIKSLPRLEEVGGYMDGSNTKIKSLPMLSKVGDNLDISKTPLSKSKNRDEELKNIKTGGVIYV